tara:strand:- start:14162 stop:14458 length:297 start_codon:yes stop_codon:yes gene_type:complete
MLLLKHVAHVSWANPDADFWVQRRGARRNLGRCFREYDPQALAVKVLDPRISPEFLYWYVTHQRLSGYFGAVAKGSLELLHITIKDLENLPIVVPNLG